MHVEGLARQAWYSLLSSSVTACTRCKSASYTNTSASQTAAEEERMKPGMTEAGSKPAKASRTAHLGYTNAYTRHLMRHHEPPMEEGHEKTKKWERVPRSEGKRRRDDAHRAHPRSSESASPCTGMPP